MGPPPPSYVNPGQQQYGQPQHGPHKYAMNPKKSAVTFESFLQAPRIQSPVAFPSHDGGCSGHFLDSVKGVFVKQKADIAEQMIGFEKENSFKVYPLDMHNAKAFFKCKEKSDTFSRQMMSGSSRPFKMKVKNQYTGYEDMIFEREYSCNCGPIGARPELKAYLFDQARGKILFGKVIDLYDMCNETFEIRDHQNKL